MKELIVKEYRGSNIEFKQIDGEIYANANSMADSIKIDNWKRSKNTNRYIEALKSSVNFTERPLMIAKRGGNEQGTWIHEKLVLSLARYIDVYFEIWCDEQITTLIREGQVSLQNDMNECIKALQLAFDESDHCRKVLEYENKLLKERLDSSNTYSTTQVCDGFWQTGNATKLHNNLKKLGIMDKKSKAPIWRLNKEYSGLGLYKQVIAKPYPDAPNEIPMSRWTEKGRLFVIKAMLSARQTKYDLIDEVGIISIKDYKAGLLKDGLRGKKLPKTIENISQDRQVLDYLSRIK